MQTSNRSRLSVAVCTTGVMTALAIVLLLIPKALTGDANGRLDLAVFPILLLARLYGPVFSAAAYVLTDILSCFLLGYAPFLPITLCKLAAGVALGLCFYRRPFSPLRSALALVAVGVVIDGLGMTLALAALRFDVSSMTAGAWLTLLADRGVSVVINTALRLVFCLTVADRLSRQGEKILRLSRDSTFESYANSFQATPRLQLHRMKTLLSLLGDPQRDGRYIHIAGTNGKGSVAQMTSAVLTEAGYRTGLYISPNLVRVNERISVDGTPISDSDMERLLAQVRPACEETARLEGEMPTQFEIWTACAHLYFKEQACDYVVLETGLGGEFDATNAIGQNELAVLTRIDLDHTALLGHTVEEIADTKCGIFKAKCATGKVISAPQEPKAEAVIRGHARAMGLVPVFVSPPAAEAFEGFCEVADFAGVGRITLPFSGVHQLENTAVAIAALEALGITGETVKNGLAKAKHPARLECLRKEPLLLYDGGHNPAGIAALCASLSRYGEGERFAVVFAAMADKDIAPSLTQLKDYASRFIYTTVLDNPRAMTPEALADKAASLGCHGTAASDLTSAIEMAGEEPCLICGSLYLYADLPPHLRSV